MMYRVFVIMLTTDQISGLGRAAAELFASHGAKIVIGDLDGAKAKDSSRELQQKGTQILCVTGDALNESFPPTLVEKALGHFGRINCLINNAGRYNQYFLRPRGHVQPSFTD